MMRHSEIWLINLDPTIGAEIKKTRPAVIVSSAEIGILPLKVIAPITDWKPNYALVEKVTLTDSQMTEIQDFCDSIRDRIDTASFEEKRQLLEMFDVRGKLAVENNEKVVYASCLLEPQSVYPVPISHLRSNLKGTQYLAIARLVIPIYRVLQGKINKNIHTPFS